MDGYFFKEPQEPLYMNFRLSLEHLVLNFSSDKKELVGPFVLQKYVRNDTRLHNIDCNDSCWYSKDIVFHSLYFNQ